ncbi:class I glutamine amidotransferase-like protein [Gymnopilus junonius]|uniref:D-lactate dehydratase n=1 Tax=Gymnopilus junonius TaxID=109634 RepID=A0A9P5NMP7_GYMJU|nr:class I glutamine amidotransferase-like protein [Gymnopilus junonius]
MPSALILIADGTEEMEFTITYDTLVRGGIKVTSAYVPDVASPTLQRISPPTAKCSRGIHIMPDVYFDLSLCGPDIFDLVVIPGGAKGAETMSKHPSVQELVRRYIERNKLVGMICAGSLAAKTAKLPQQPLTSHPSVKAELEHGKYSNFEYLEDSVVISNNLVTSRGPGTAFPFALTLVELLCGSERREEIRGPMVFPPDTPF